MHHKARVAGSHLFGPDHVSGQDVLGEAERTRAHVLPLLAHQVNIQLHMGWVGGSVSLACEVHCRDIHLALPRVQPDTFARLTAHHHMLDRLALACMHTQQGTMGTRYRRVHIPFTRTHLPFTRTHLS